MIKKNKQKKEEPEATKIIGKLVPGLEKIIEEAAEIEPFKKRLEEVSKEIERRLRKSSSISIRVDKRNSIHPRVKRGIIEEKRKEPLIDVFEDHDTVHVITEFPSKIEDIKLKIKGQKLTISTESEQREVELPCRVKRIIKKQYKNNILEVKLKKNNL